MDLFLKSQKSENRKMSAKFLALSQNLEETLRRPQFSDLINGLFLKKPEKWKSQTFGPFIKAFTVQLKDHPKIK